MYCLGCLQNQKLSMKAPALLETSGRPHSGLLQRGMHMGYEEGGQFASVRKNGIFLRLMSLTNE